MRPSSLQSESHPNGSPVGALSGLGVFGGLFARGAVAIEVGDLAWLQAMLDVEAALAGALAEAGLAPVEVAAEIADQCDASSFDVTELGRGAGAAGTPVPALLAALEQRLSPEAAAHLHRGATSQDVVDTAGMLVTRRALAPLLADLSAAADAAAGLAAAHRDTLAVGRTLLQQALPTSFGLKAAGWMTGLDEAAERLSQIRERGLALQLGGAVGTLASLGERGVVVAAAMARRLELVEPALPWQANRVRPALLGAALGAAAGAAGKVGADVALLAQTELGEVSEGGLNGGSSTLPQKRNPVTAVAAVACARRTPGLVATMLGAMLGEHERSAGSWQAEWETLSELLRLTGSGAAAARGTLERLEVHPDRMRANLDLTGGLVMAEALATALSEKVGRASAHRLAEQAAGRAMAELIPLRQAAEELAEIREALGVEGIEAALDPARYLGSAEQLIERALETRPSRSGGDDVPG
jgi:3-carboxy-cis,cis-muconate cycloisomerase